MTEQTLFYKIHKDAQGRIQERNWQGIDSIVAPYIQSAIDATGYFTLRSESGQPKGWFKS